MTTTRRTVIRAGLAGALGGAAALATGLPASGDSTIHDNVVIGTGYGGAVAAYRLSAAGQRVLMLEMGQRWDTPGQDGNIFSGILEPDERAVWFGERTDPPVSSVMGIDLRADVGYGPGVLDKKNLGQMSVYRGIGVGGGSLVNGGISLRPRHQDLARELRGNIANRLIRTYIPRAESRLQLNTIRDKFFEQTPWYQYSRTARDSAIRAGFAVDSMPNFYDFAYMEQEAAGTVPASALAGELIYGNNHGRRSLPFTYLGSAEATGLVSIQTLTEAVTVKEVSRGVFEISCRVRDHAGAVVDEPIVRARRVFFGAGSVGTSELLLRSREGGGLNRLNSHVGRHWGANGNITLGRNNPDGITTGEFQSTVSVTGIDARQGRYKTYSEVAPLPLGIETGISYYLAIAQTRQTADFVLDGDGVKLTWRAAQSHEALERARAMFDHLNDVEGTDYRDDLFGTPGKIFTDDWTYHPLGGATIGRATDWSGKLHGYDGLYVVDGALLPESIGANPLVTIAAVAEMVMDSVLR